MELPKSLAQEFQRVIDEEVWEQLGSRMEVESLRAAVDRVRDEATGLLAKTDLSGGVYHKAAQMFLRALDGEA